MAELGNEIQKTARFEPKPPRPEDIESGIALEKPPATLSDLKQLLPVLSPEETARFNKWLGSARHTLFEDVMGKKYGSDLRNTLSKFAKGPYAPKQLLISKKENELFLANIDGALEELLAFPEDTIDLMDTGQAEERAYKHNQVVPSYSEADLNIRYSAFKKAIEAGDLNVIAVALMKAENISSLELRLIQENIFEKKIDPYSSQYGAPDLADKGSLEAYLLDSTRSKIADDKSRYSLLSKTLKHRLNIYPGSGIHHHVKWNDILTPYINK